MNKKDNDDDNDNDDNIDIDNDNIDSIDASIYVNSVYFELDSPFMYRYRLCASASFSGLHSDLYPYKGVVLYRVFG